MVRKTTLLFLVAVVCLWALVESGRSRGGSRGGGSRRGSKSGASRSGSRGGSRGSGSRGGSRSSGSRGGSRSSGSRGNNKQSQRGGSRGNQASRSNRGQPQRSSPGKPGRQATAGRPGPRRQILKTKTRSRLQDLYRVTAKRRGKDISRLASDTLVWSPPENFNDGTEASLNAEVSHDLFENDIRLTLPQLNDLISGFTGRRRFKRKLSRTSGRWQTTIPYSFDGSISSSTARDIRVGLDDWEQHTCLRFIEGNFGGDSMQFMDGGGCYSYVGRTGGAQQVSIGNGCQLKGIVSHEVGHALGLWHEQSRTDRDSFVNIALNNIFDQSLGNFEKRRSDELQTFGIPYDLGSVMHYGPRAFVKVTNLFAIKTWDSRYQNTIGQREGVSFIDAKMINNAYCSGTCGNSLSCQHGGYPNPNNCGVCMCPRGLGGNCDRAASSNCGDDLVASPNSQNVASTWVTPSQTCSWHIKSNNGKKIKLRINQLSYPCYDTCSSYLEVKFNSDFQQSGARFCCSSQATEIESETDEMVLIHVTDSATGSSYGGFQATYWTSGSAGFKLTPAPPTQRPVVRTPAPRRSSWGSWSSWSGCNQECGGCGIRQRLRECQGSGCPGQSQDTQYCNAQPCTSGGGSVSTCTGPLYVPCSFWDYYWFNPRSVSIPVQGIPDDLAPGGQAYLLDAKPSQPGPQPGGNRGGKSGGRRGGKGSGGNRGSRGGGGRSGGGRKGGRRGGRGPRGKRHAGMCWKNFQYQCSSGASKTCCQNFSLRGNSCLPN